MILKCSSCGADVNFQDKLTANCSYCGSTQSHQFKASKIAVNQSDIKYKPEISYASYYIDSSKPLFGSHYRVDGGWMNEYGSFTPDQRKKDGYNELALRNRKISKAEEFLKWFSDNELDQIESCDLSGNKLQSIKDVIKLEKVIKLDVSYNALQNLNDLSNLSYNIDYLNLSNNLITDYNGLKSFTIRNLDLSNNNITAIQDFPRESNAVNLSGNKITSVKNLDEILRSRTLRYPISIDLTNNPIEDIEYLKDFKFLALPLEKYEELEKSSPYTYQVGFGGDTSFKNVRYAIQNPDTLNRVDSALQLLFEEINKQTLYITLDEEKIDALGLPKHYASFTNSYGIIYKISNQYSWGEFCEYFGIAVKGYKKKSDHLSNNSETSASKKEIVWAIITIIILFITYICFYKS